ncbi:MAG: hypothetical protein D6B25_17120 [Desulfobulbaceae bacterium]|nr:MAG: hypothetical protein D6B25_17120 [Desulfobulbaceae bacterium]
MYGKVILWAILMVFIIVTAGFAAQSTADVSATPEMKRFVRNEILGDKASTIKNQREYVIGHGDILSVLVYGEGDMAASSPIIANMRQSYPDSPRTSQKGIMVMMDGRVSLKHVGDVEVVGLTLTELADYLKKLFATIYDDPIVTTTLEQSNSLRYTILGNIARPGILFLDYPLTLVQALARSGGFNEWANKDITVVREKVDDEKQSLFDNNTLEFDYNDFVSGEALERNIHIENGDIIIIH